VGVIVYVVRDPYCGSFQGQVLLDAKAKLLKSNLDGDSLAALKSLKTLPETLTTLPDPLPILKTVPEVLVNQPLALSKELVNYIN